MKRWLRLPIARTGWVALLLLLTSTDVAHGQPTAAIIEYYHLDALGSVRVVTNQSGVVVRRYDFAPFGEMDSPCTQSADPRLFTGHERDRETCLDYMGARYYRSTSGRFLTIDPVLDQQAALLDPQRWNRYAYARNNPMRFVDPDGRNPLDPLDWVSAFWSAYDAYYDPSGWNLATLGLDVVNLANPLDPFLPAPGTLIRAARVVDGASNAVAENAADAVRLSNRLSAQEIAGGHSFGKHVQQRAEFPGITTPDQFASHIEGIMNNPNAVRHLSQGRTAYWHSASGTVVIRNPGSVDGGTAFRPLNGRSFFDGLR